ERGELQLFPGDVRKAGDAALRDMEGGAWGYPRGARADFQGWELAQLLDRESGLSLANRNAPAEQYWREWGDEETGRGARGRDRGVDPGAGASSGARLPDRRRGPGAGGARGWAALRQEVSRRSRGEVSDLCAPRGKGGDAEGGAEVIRRGA